MGVIIGATTTVSFNSGHVTQVSWGINPNIQRVYVLGSWAPYADAQVKAPTETLNITVYSPGPSYPIEPSEGCVNANQETASVSPAGCGAGSTGPSSTSWYVNSYSFSKGDARTPGTESWSMMQYVTMDDNSVVLPTYVLRGISEGSVTSSEANASTAGPKAGISFYGNVDVGSQGSVSAGQIGRGDYQYMGVINAVGAASAGSGDVASASCSIPYTPLYI